METISWEGVAYSRLDSATLLFHKAAPWLLQTIKEAAGDVVKATKAIAAAFNMKNDFPVFMAVMDLAWFRPDLIDPASPVPTGSSKHIHPNILSSNQVHWIRFI